MTVSAKTSRSSRKTTPLRWPISSTLSVNQTLGRTIMTSATTLIAALSLTILGGGAIHDFALTMSLGVFIGTFSSVFVSNPILLMLGDTRQYMVARKKVEYERPGEHGVV